MAGHELGSWGALECDPDRPDRGGPVGATDLHVKFVPLTVHVTATGHGLVALVRRLEQLIPEHLGVARVQSEPGLELPGLQSASRMPRVQAVQLEPRRIDDGIVTITDLHEGGSGIATLNVQAAAASTPATNPEEL